MSKIHNEQLLLLQAQDQQQQMMTAMIQSEIRATARELFVAQVLPQLNDFAEPDIEKIKRAAKLAARIAPYVHQALGLIQINEAKHWGTDGQT